MDLLIDYLKNNIYPLEQQAAQLWYSINTNHIQYLKEMYGILSTREQKYVQNLKFKNLKEAYVIRHGILRLLLGCYLQKEPKAIKFSYNAYDKPLLAIDSKSCNIEFNISYTGNHNLYAFILNTPIGVDIEKAVSTTVEDTYAKEFMSTEEYQYFTKTAGTKREKYFFTIWTRKEALIKAIGKGFSCDTKNMSVHTPLKNRQVTVKENLRTYQITSFKLTSSYFAALCVETSDDYKWQLRRI